MAGLSRAAAALLLGLACGALVAADSSGGRLYLQGQGQDPVHVRLGDPPVEMPAEHYACARCHGGNGLGGSEGGVAAPALANAMPPGNAQLAWLQAALRDGRGRDGRRLLSAMPRYTLSQRDLLALSDYLTRLPYAAQPGVDAAQLRIAVDLSGTPFAPDMQAVLRAVLQAEAAQINAEGGLYGRSLELVDNDDDAYFGLGWVTEPARALPHLAVRTAPDPAAPPCRGCCASLHPGIAAQLDWLRGWLRDQGQTPELRGPLAAALGAADEPNSGTPRAVVYLGDPAGLPAPRSGTRVYILADLGLPPVARGDLYAVTPLDLTRQMAEVERLQQAEPQLRGTPRLATTVLELRRALRMLADALASGGRHASAGDVCARLQAETVAQHTFSLLRLSDGAVMSTPQP